MENNLEKWRFGTDNDYLVSLVLEGKKTATTSIFSLDSVPALGEESILVYEDGTPACITKTKKIIITNFKNITEKLALLEGENKDLAGWRKNHRKFFKTIDKNFNDDTRVIFEIFEVIKKFA